MAFGASFTSRNSRTWLAIATCALGVVAGPTAARAASAAPTGSTSSPTAKAALQRALAAATKAGSVHVLVQFFSGSTTGRVVQDSALQTGKQTVAVDKAIASTVLVGGTAYISGNSQGLSSYFRIPNALLSTTLGHWISVPPTDSTFQSVTANLTLPSALHNVSPTGTLTTGKRLKVNGRWANGIGGTAADGGHVTLFVAATGRPLPLEAVETSQSGTTRVGEIITFSKWGEPVQVAKPTGAVPISLIEASTPANN